MQATYLMSNRGGGVGEGEQVGRVVREAGRLGSRVAMTWSLIHRRKGLTFHSELHRV